MKYLCHVNTIMIFVEITFLKEVELSHIKHGYEYFLPLSPKVCEDLSNEICEDLSNGMTDPETLQVFKAKIKNWVPVDYPCKLCKIYMLQVGFI